MYIYQAFCWTSGRSFHYAWIWFLCSQSKCRKSFCTKIDCQNLKSSKRNRYAKQGIQRKGNNFRSKVGKYIDQKPANILKYGSPLFNSGYYAGEIIIRKNQICRFPGNISSSQPHGNSNICPLQGW